MKVLCPSCERLVELVDLRVERGGLVARCPACGAEQRQQLPARPVTVPSSRAVKPSGAADAPRAAGGSAPADEDEWWSCHLDCEPDDSGPVAGLRWHTRGSFVVAPPSRNGRRAAQWIREPGEHPLPDSLRLLEFLADACEEVRV